MPVTFRVADHPSKAWVKPNVTSRDELLCRSCPHEYRECVRIIQSSMSASTFDSELITPSVNGFVYAAWDAYSNHHHLTVRPDDVWFAILSQLNFYINAHAEDLRSHFVAHEGQKELNVEEVGTTNSVDFGALARRMTGLIQQNVKDPNLRDWIMPTFTTTTVDDRTTAAVLMMGSLQAYFEYTASLLCGIPSVTLLRERKDYEDMLQRLDKLEELGPEARDWANLLRPVLHGFIFSFDDATTAEVQEFWSTIVHHTPGGSGPDYLSGWLTAFCFWSKDGKPLYYYQAPKFDAEYKPNKVENIIDYRYELGGVKYHSIETDKIPTGFASVPVKVNDNGVIYKTKMLAGSIGIGVTKSGERDKDGKEKLDSVRSLSGWFMYELKSVEELESGELSDSFRDLMSTFER